ncbi:MAG: 6-carboxytetrahydropterin synthase, partial [Anaerolineales bacterium]|nr:6-carboxytetrahydropterin synthase [Anaerolineales bacterium]
KKTMYLIRKQFHFSASHQLDGLPAEHQCARLHGHNYIVEIVLQATAVDKNGFVVDYLDLKPFKDYIDHTLDHHHLNDLFDFPTSAENLAYHLFCWAKAKWPQVSGMRVSETPKTWAEYWEDTPR